MGAIKNGLQYAKDAKGANQSIKDKYLIPWNTKEKSITGGGIFIGSSYINLGQNTIYLQKFDVNDDRNGTLFTHQYMTNVLAPYSESKSIYNGYQKSGLLNTAMTFIIPVYNNMPSIPIQNPNIKEGDFIQDTANLYCNTEQVNIRTGPSTSYEIITTISKDTKMTRIRKGKQTGERWDQVILDNGIIGYIFQTYVTEILSVPVTGISLNESEIYMSVGDNFQIKSNVEPSNADDKKVIYKSDNEQIITVDTKGIITAKKEGKAKIVAVSNQNPAIKAECLVTVYKEMSDDEIYIDNSLTVNSLEISGINYNKNTVADIKGKITTKYEIEIVDYKNNVLKDSDIVGTGSKIIIKDNEKIIRQYHIIIYGDVDGSGKIDSVDLLVLQRHILEIKKLEPIFRKAANIDKSGNKPSSVDLLLIQRHILQLQIIKQ